MSDSADAGQWAHLSVLIYHISLQTFKALNQPSLTHKDLREASLLGPTCASNASDQWWLGLSEVPSWWDHFTELRA